MKLVGACYVWKSDVSDRQRLIRMAELEGAREGDPVEEEWSVGKEDKVMEKEEEEEEVMEQDVVDYDFLKLRICHKMHGGGKVVNFCYWCLCL